MLLERELEGKRSLVCLDIEQTSRLFRDEQVMSLLREDNNWWHPEERCPRR